MVSLQNCEHTFTDSKLFVLRKLTETPPCVCFLRKFLHLFWECPVVQPYQSDVGALICRNIHVGLNMSLILFGDDQKVDTNRFFYPIILSEKFYIIKSKLQKEKPYFKIFIRTIKQRAKIERYGSVNDVLWIPCLQALSFHTYNELKFAKALSLSLSLSLSLLSLIHI